jgi:hypothetical protein
LEISAERLGLLLIEPIDVADGFFVGGIDKVCLIDFGERIVVLLQDQARNVAETGEGEAKIGDIAIIPDFGNGGSAAAQRSRKECTEDEGYEGH